MLRLQGEMIRGGTSKCWIFDHHHVAATGADTDALLLAAFNAADPRQIDGVGGASSTTSKAAIVRAVGGAGGVDVEYAFAQVGIGDERVEWTSNCGNCATAVALYAAHRGLVPVTGDTTTVRMRNVNTGARLTGTIPTPGGTVPEEGGAAVPGTTALGVPVLLGFVDPAGSSTGRALPTGHADREAPRSYMRLAIALPLFLIAGAVVVQAALGPPAVQTTAAASPKVLSGLSAGTQYSFRICARTAGATEVSAGVTTTATTP